MVAPESGRFPRVMLGCQPFIGESYQGPERNREYAERVSDRERVKEIPVNAASEHGVTGLAAVPPDSSRLADSYLRAVGEAEEALGIEFALLPCFSIPMIVKGEPVNGYRRWLTYYVYERTNVLEDLGLRFVSDPILLTRPGWEERFSKVLAEGTPYSTAELEEFEVDYERLGRCVSHFEGRRTLFAEAGSETDFLAMTGMLGELEELVRFLRGRGFERVLLGVHHAGVTIPLLEASDIKFDGYVTPVNRMGALMLPNSEMALRSIRSTERQVVAIRTMLGGESPGRGVRLRIPQGRGRQLHGRRRLAAGAGHGYDCVGGRHCLTWALLGSDPRLRTALHLAASEEHGMALDEQFHTGKT